ncbi:MAG: CvpA family protein [Prevotellaceae bacterium]|jgi:membrane protein required for colicin V production|nr:CvpA family protein [Prevotellaceae bacterium]
MTLIDIIIAVIIVAGMVLGYIKGFIKQLATLLGIIGGLLAARALYAPVAEKLTPSLTDSITVAQVISFIGIWIAIPILFWIVAALLTRMLEAIKLGWLNHLLGSILGGVKYLLLISLLLCVTDYFDTDNKLIKKRAKEESLFYYPAKSIVDVLFPAAETMLLPVQQATAVSFLPPEVVGASDQG